LDVSNSKDLLTSERATILTPSRKCTTSPTFYGHLLPATKVKFSSFWIKEKEGEIIALVGFLCLRLIRFVFYDSNRLRVKQAKYHLTLFVLRSDEVTFEDFSPLPSSWSYLGRYAKCFVLSFVAADDLFFFFFLAQRF
jgi:hypothetical protein